MAKDVTMQYRRLGESGLRLSALSLGGWATYGESVNDQDVIKKILTRAYEAGINFFDIADVYAHGEAERLMGQVLSGFPRHTLILASKLYWPMSKDPNDKGLSRKHIMESVDKSLKRLGTDYLDIYFCHRFDPETPVDETLRAMDDLIHQGKILYWGTSEWSGDQIRDVHDRADRRNCYGPQVEQPQYNLIERWRVENDVRPAASERGMGLVVWSPLASGLLSGKYDKGVPAGSRLADMGWLRDRILTDDNVKKVREMKAIADDLGCSRSQLAIAWTAAQPGISSVITGATKLEQLEENLGALRVKIDEGVQERLDALFPADHGEE